MKINLLKIKIYVYFFIRFCAYNDFQNIDNNVDPTENHYNNKNTENCNQDKQKNFDNENQQNKIFKEKEDNKALKLTKEKYKIVRDDSNCCYK